MSRRAPCKFYRQGRCNKGPNCPFSHGEVESFGAGVNVDQRSSQPFWSTGLLGDKEKELIAELDEHRNHQTIALSAFNINTDIPANLISKRDISVEELRVQYLQDPQSYERHLAVRNADYNKVLDFLRKESRKAARFLQLAAEKHAQGSDLANMKSFVQFDLDLNAPAPSTLGNNILGNTNSNSVNPFSSSTTNAFGGGSAFGQNVTQSSNRPSASTGAFGQNPGMFGASSNSATNNPFGAATTSNNSFGSSSFGAAASATPAFGGSGFGTSTAGTPSIGNSAFGAAPAASSAFGSTGFKSTTTATPAFGSSSFGAFGSTNTGASSFGSSGFGSTNTGASSFGSSGFGSTNTGASSFGSSGFSSTDGTSKAPGATNAQPSFGSSPFGSLGQPTSSPFGSISSNKAMPFGSSAPANDGSSASPFQSIGGAENKMLTQPAAATSSSPNGAFALPKSTTSPFGSFNGGAMSAPAAQNPFGATGSSNTFGAPTFGQQQKPAVPEQPFSAEPKKAPVDPAQILVYAKIDELTEVLKNLFLKDTFRLGNVPEVPPAIELC